MSEYDGVDWAKEGRKEALRVIKNLENMQWKLEKLTAKRDLIAQVVFATKGYFNHSKNDYRIFLESFCATVMELWSAEWERRNYS